MGGEAKGQEMLGSQLPSYPLLGGSRFLPTEIAPITQPHIHGEAWSPMDRLNLIILQGPPDGARR